MSQGQLRHYQKIAHPLRALSDFFQRFKTWTVSLCMNESSLVTVPIVVDIVMEATLVTEH